MLFCAWLYALLGVLVGVLFFGSGVLGCWGVDGCEGLDRNAAGELTACCIKPCSNAQCSTLQICLQSSSDCDSPKQHVRYRQLRAHGCKHAQTVQAAPKLNEGDACVY